MRDDNSQMQFEHHQAEEWHEHNRRLIDEIHEVVEKEIKESENEMEMQRRQRIRTV